MPKQSRVNKSPLITQRLANLEINHDQVVTNLKNLFERLCKLETRDADLEELEHEVGHLNGQLDVANRAIIRQAEEREGLARQIAAIEGKVLAKDIAAQTNVELTARVKELQRQLTEAKHEIDRLTINGTKEPTVKTVEVLKLSDGRIVDEAYIEELRDYAKTQEQRADSVQRELNQTFEELEQLKFRVAAERSKPSFWRIFGP